MDVQHAELALADVPEAVHDADGSGDVRARAGPDDLVADGELGLAFEDVERVDVIRVAVGRDALELRPEAELDRLELGQLGQDPVVPGPARDPFAPAGAGHDPVHGDSVPYEHLFV